MESNYETLRLNSQIETAAFLGRRFFPSTSCHDANQKGTPVIDYFDYVNPSDVQENGKVDENVVEESQGSSSDIVEHTAGKDNELDKEKRVEETVREKRHLEENVTADNVHDGETKTAETKKIPLTDEISDTADDERLEEDIGRTDLHNESHEPNIKGGLKIKKLKKLEQKRKNKHLKRDEKLTVNEDVVKECMEENSNNRKSEIIRERVTESHKENGAEKNTEVGVAQIDCSVTVCDKFETKLEQREVSEVRVSRLHPELTCKPEYRTALQVDTSYQAGVSSDSNCSQYSASSWTSENDTSSSLDPSPSQWNSYIDSGVSLGTSTGGIYSDTSDVSGEDCSYFDNTNNQRFHIDLQQQGEGKYVQIRTFFPGHKFCYSNGYSNGAIQNNSAFPTVNIYNDNGGVAVIDYEGYGNYSDPMSDGTGEINCDYCRYCACSEYEGCPQEPMLPGDVFYYSSNSIVLCVKQNRQRERPKQVR